MAYVTANISASILLITRFPALLDSWDLLSFILFKKIYDCEKHLERIIFLYCTLGDFFVDLQ